MCPAVVKGLVSDDAARRQALRATPTETVAAAFFVFWLPHLCTWALLVAARHEPFDNHLDFWSRAAEALIAGASIGVFSALMHLGLHAMLLSTRLSNHQCKAALLATVRWLPFVPVYVALLAVGIMEVPGFGLLADTRPAWMRHRHWLWFANPVWLILLAGLMLGHAAWVGRKAPWSREGLCTSCGYNLTGSPGAGRTTCPECGATIAHHIQQPKLRRQQPTARK